VRNAYYGPERYTFVETAPFQPYQAYEAYVTHTSELATTRATSQTPPSTVMVQTERHCHFGHSIRHWYA